MYKKFLWDLNKNVPPAKKASSNSLSDAAIRRGPAALILILIEKHQSWVTSDEGVGFNFGGPTMQEEEL